MSRWVDGWVGVQVDVRVDVRVDGCTGGWMDVRVDSEAAFPTRRHPTPVEYWGLNYHQVKFYSFLLIMQIA